MDAADIGWSVLKAPLVPGSLRQTSDKTYTAQFIPIGDDLEEGPVEPVDARLSEWANNLGSGEGIDAWMRGEWFDSPNMVQVVGYDGGDFEVSSAGIEGALQRQGRATALYDMIAAIIERRREGSRLTPGYRSDDALELWNAVSPDEQWRVRNDLWADGYGYRPPTPPQVSDYKPYVAPTGMTEHPWWGTDDDDDGDFFD